MPLRDHVRTAIASYPTTTGFFMWRSDESITAVTVLSELIDGRHPVDDHTLEANVDFLLTGSSYSPGAVDRRLGRLTNGGRLWTLLTGAVATSRMSFSVPSSSVPSSSRGSVVPSSSSSSSNAPVRQPPPTLPSSSGVRPTTTTVVTSTTVRPPSAIVISPSSSSSSSSRVSPPPLDPFRGPSGGTSRMAASVTSLATATIAHRSLESDLATAREVLESAKMRRIVVMDPEVYDSTPTAKKAAKTKENSAHFVSYKTSMTTLPRTADDWEKLGVRTVKWEMGNCQQIMAAMFHVLKNSSSWSSPIELVRNKGHHFLIVGRPDTGAGIRDPSTWGSAWRVDLWWQNLSRPADEQRGAWPLGMVKCSKDDFLIHNAGVLTVDLAWQP